MRAVQPPIHHQARLTATQRGAAVRLDFRISARGVPDAELIDLAFEVSTAAHVLRIAGAERVMNRVHPELPRHLTIAAHRSGLHAVQETVHQQRGLVIPQHYLMPCAEGNGPHIDRGEIPHPHPHLTGGKDLDVAIIPQRAREGCRAELIHDHSRPLRVEPDFERHRLVDERVPEVGRNDEVIHAVESKRIAGNARATGQDRRRCSAQPAVIRVR